MKILIFNWQDIYNPFGGGAESHLHEIFKRIAAMGNDVTLYCCKVNDFSEEENIDGIRVLRQGGRNLFNFFVPFRYFKQFKNENYDIIIDDINKIPFYTPLFINKPLLAISHHFFGKSIFREASFIEGLYVYFSEWLVNIIYKNTPFAVVSQSTLDEFIRRKFNQNHFTIITNAIEAKEFPMKVAEKPSYPIITYFGRLKKYKSVDHLVIAFAQINKQFPQAQLHFIGRGSFQPELVKLAKQLGIKDKTIFHGFVDEDKKKELLSNSYVVVNTSMKEGWGITNIEANACGTPVISADVPGLKDSVKKDVSGLLYEYGNINDLSDKLKMFLSDDNLKERLSNGAVEWAASFSWDNSAKEMIALCNKVIANHKL